MADTRTMRTYASSRGTSFSPDAMSAISKVLESSLERQRSVSAAAAVAPARKPPSIPPPALPQSASYSNLQRPPPLVLPVRALSEVREASLSSPPPYPPPNPPSRGRKNTEPERLICVDNTKYEDWMSGLPDELFVHILSYFSPKELLSLCLVSRRWNAIASDNVIWAPIYDKIVGRRNMRNPKKSSWKQKLLKRVHQWKCQREAVICNRYTIDQFHENTINVVQFDQEKLITAGRDGEIKIWKWGDKGFNECIHTITDHNGPVLCCQYDDDKIISGSSDRTIMIFDIHTYVCRAVLPGHSDSITCLKFDDTHLVTGSRDCTVKIWDLATLKCILTIKNSGPIASVTFTKEYLACSTEKFDVRVWNWNELNLKYSWPSWQPSPTLSPVVSPSISPSTSPPSSPSWFFSLFSSQHHSPSAPVLPSNSDAESHSHLLKLLGISWGLEVCGDRLIITGHDAKPSFKIYDISPNGLNLIREVTLKSPIYCLRCNKDKIVVGTKTGIVLFDSNGNKIQDLWNGGRTISALYFKNQKLVFSQMEIDYEQERRPEVDLIVIFYKSL